jgi:hypothetical protein
MYFSACDLGCYYQCCANITAHLLCLCASSQVLKHYTVLLSHQVSSAPALRSFALDDKHTAAPTAATTATLPAGAVSMSYSDALQLLALVTADGHFRSVQTALLL